MLQIPSQENKIDYKRKCAKAKKKIREAYRKSWDYYISCIDDAHGRQEYAYKVLKHLNKERKIQPI